MPSVILQCSSAGCCYADCYFAKYVLVLSVVMLSVITDLGLFYLHVSPISHLACSFTTPTINIF
jgi:hypothetical protein